MPATASTAPIAPNTNRPDRHFYARHPAFGRFGMRWLTPQLMAAEHRHGHIEMNWLTEGSIDYLFDGRPLGVPARRPLIFWAGIPHRSTDIDLGPSGEARMCNVYLPLDAFLMMPHIGAMHEALLSGSVIALPEGAMDEATLMRWYSDYRSGNADRLEVLKSELAAMFRRATLTGWDTVLSGLLASRPVQPHRATPIRHVVAMLRFILEHLDEQFRAEDVAGAVGLHPNYALGLFTSVMHVPMRRFVIRMRLVRARALLFESGTPIEAIAFQSGFNSLSQFYAHFRKAYGVTPNQMREAVTRRET